MERSCGTFYASFEILDDEEVKAVLAHELGHIKHWDFVVMTVAQLVPIVLYQIYRVCDDLMTSSRSRRSEKKQQGLVVAAAIAYIAYMISEYLVKFISRLREYHADKFSCYATRNPNALLTALIKIGFGVVKNKEDSNKQNERAVQSMGIMNFASSSSISLASKGNDGEDEIQAIKNIMRWDLWSPWAKYYELHSTHPLTLKEFRQQEVTQLF